MLYPIRTSQMMSDHTVVLKMTFDRLFYLLIYLLIGCLLMNFYKITKLVIWNTFQNLDYNNFFESRRRLADLLRWSTTLLLLKQWSFTFSLISVINSRSMSINVLWISSLHVSGSAESALFFLTLLLNFFFFGLSSWAQQIIVELLFYAIAKSLFFH